MTAISFAEPAEPAEPAAAAAPPEPAEPGTSSRWWRIDLLIPLVGVGALVVYGFRGFRGYLGGDLGLYVYAGQQSQTECRRTSAS